MLQKEQLEVMKVDELRKFLKENGISCYKNGKRITKAEMIERYLEELNNKKSFELPKETVNKIDEVERQERKNKYIEQAKVGTIIAFRLQDGNGRVISAAITKKSTKGRKFLVKTKYGAEHKISFDDVLWVRTNKRWPKGIYMLFKQNIKEEKGDGKEIC